MSAPLSFSDAFPDQPVFGAPQFTGRAGLAQNLLSRCRRGQSVLLYGGPKLGKTSMLRHLQWLIDQDGDAASGRSAASYVDMADERARQEFLRGSDRQQTSIRLLDNCEHLLKERDVITLRGFTQRDTFAHATVWAGSRTWHDAILEKIRTLTLRRVPLAVLFDGEAQELLNFYLTPHQVTAALTAGGTHPYVLKMIAHELRSDFGNPEYAIERAAARLIPFYKMCREALRQPSEHALLQYLMQESRPVAPQEAARAIGLAIIKPTADALCSLGLMSRWNLKNGAMLHANCRLFNDWYLTSKI